MLSIRPQPGHVLSPSGPASPGRRRHGAALTAINQLWVADLTYIRLRGEFVFLALVMDAFSRKAVGWALERTLTTRLPLLALHQAIAQRQPPAGLVPSCAGPG